MDLNLSGKRSLVFGASQGIGASTAIELATMESRVTCVARSEEKLQNVLERLPGKGHQMLVCDVGNREDLEIKVKESISTSGDYHVLVCNSGGPKGGPLLDSDEDTFMSGFENHVLVNMLLAKCLVPGMKNAGYGRIINIISTSVKAPIPNLGVSNTIRGAVANLAKTLSVELAPFGITVNNVLPGYTLTPRLESLLEGASKKTGKSIEDTTEEWRNRVPMKRFAQPEEVASAIAFLASPAAGYVSGINIPVDGGRTQSL